VYISCISLSTFYSVVALRDGSGGVGDASVEVAVVGGVVKGGVGDGVFLVARLKMSKHSV